MEEFPLQLKTFKGRYEQWLEEDIVFTIDDGKIGRLHKDFPEI